MIAAFRLQDHALAKLPCYAHRDGGCPLRAAAHCCTCGSYDACRCTYSLMVKAAQWYRKQHAQKGKSL